jgi:3-oxoacyl-[acyl-carrier protein] reductase
MSAEWNGQVALVTGGGRGIGRATAKRLAAQGAAVGVNYTARAETAEAVAVEIRGAGGSAIAVQADVADAGAVAAMVARVEQELGSISILVNNAGIDWSGALDAFEPNGWERLRQVNLDGVIHMVRAVMGGMRARRYGRIVNVSSIAGIGTAMRGTTWYAATKAAVNILTRRFAMELGKDGITCNCVAPGVVRTDMTEGSMSADDWRAAVARVSTITMTGRVGEPEDIANAIAFLAAPESGWITGQVLVVDGGRMDYLTHA